MPPRILFGGLFHETHTFLEETTKWEDFEVIRDQEIFARIGDASTTDGFLTTAREHGFEVIPTITANALPAGTVEDEAFETFWQEFAARARPALTAGVDAIYLVLHGAMVTHSLADPEGELLERLRALPGAAELPIFGVFDLHANLTARMCRLANGLVAYRENPHTDSRASAVHATELLARALREGVVPRMAWCHPPILWAPPGTGTATEPVKTLERFARDLEAAHPEIWACSIVPGFSFGDTPDSGVSLGVIHTDATVARAQLERAAALAWSLREKGDITYPTVDEVVRQLPANPPGPIILVEPSDNIGGGAPGDGTGILRSLLQHQVQRSLLAINDPAAVAALAHAAPGETRRLAIGGKGSRLDPGPVELALEFVSRSDGNFELEDKHSHLASMNGVHIVMGPCAVVRTAGITILLTSRKTPPFDLGQYRSQGIEPRDFAVIGVKAAVAHRRAYDPIMHATHYVDTPGPCSSNPAVFPWRHLRRPIHPLDPIVEPNHLYA